MLTEKKNQTRSQSISKINIDEFSQYSHQLSLLTEELSTLKEQKEALNEYNQQLIKRISECKSENQVLSSAHEKMYNETRHIHKYTQRFEQERVKHSKSVNEMAENIFRLETIIEELLTKKEELEKMLKKEAKSVVKLQEIISKMKSELVFQERDRDKLKFEVATSEKQIQQMWEKVENLKASNHNFIKKIKTSIKKLS